MTPRDKDMKGIGRQAIHEETAVVFGIGICLLGLLWGVSMVLLASAVLMILSLLIPVVAQGVHIAWTAFGKAAGWVNGFIILGVLFYLVLTPLALLRRGMKGSHFHNMKGGSYFQEGKGLYDPKNLEDPW